MRVAGPGMAGIIEETWAVCGTASGRSISWLACSLRRIIPASVVALLGVLCGCGGFFVYPGNNNGNGGGSGSSLDFVYVANATSATLAGFTIGTGSLSAVPNSPYTLPVSPTAVVINPANTILYVAGGAAIYGYAIQTTGALSALNGGSPMAAATVQSMDISPDGQWLLALDQSGASIDEYRIDSSTGGLTSQTVSFAASGIVVPRGIRVSPNAQFVFVALGTAGDLVFPFNTGTGALSTPLALSQQPGTSDNGLAVSPGSDYLYIARSGVNGGVAVYSVGLGGSLSAVTGSPFAAGAQPVSIVLNKAGTSVYAANQTDSTISGFSIGAGGVLTAISGSPYASGSLVTALAADNSGNYLLAAARNGSPDLSLYSFDATTVGKLNLAASTATGNDPVLPVALAATR